MNIIWNEILHTRNSGRCVGGSDGCISRCICKANKYIHMYNQERYIPGMVVDALGGVMGAVGASAR
jgi:hypothetical protein